MTTEHLLLSAAADVFSMGKNWIFTDSNDAAWVAAAPGTSTVDLVVDAGAGFDTLVLNASYQGAHFFTLKPMAIAGITAILPDGSEVQFINFDRLTFHGTAGDTSIALGTSAANTIIGGALDDTFLFGFGGNDTINGKAGNDVIDGGAGNDVIIGNTGRDRLTGGTGADKFRLLSAVESKATATDRDVITDFKHGIDKIDVSAIDGLSSASGFRTFKFIKEAGFDGKKGELHFIHLDHVGTASDLTLVEGDINGDRHPDFQIALKGLIGLTAVDFIL